MTGSNATRVRSPDRPRVFNRRIQQEKREAVKILYAGDGPVDGPAKYLAAVIRWMKAGMIHVPPSSVLTAALLKKDFDLVILSDFPASQMRADACRELAAQVRKGTGLLAVGGWASFAGPFAGWHGTEIEDLLPVTCLGKDDRINFPSGAYVIRKQGYPGFQDAWFRDPPVICGLNRICPKKGASIILSARKTFLKPDKGLRAWRPALEKAEYPLLVAAPGQKAAALATDLAPHWCGGIVDWGPERIAVHLKGGVDVEGGNFYFEFVAALLRNLSRTAS